MNAYLKALRLPFLAGSVTPVIIGSTFAFKEGSFILSFFFVTMLGVAALHVGANLLNDYYDAWGSDPLNVRVTPFSGGSRVIQDGQVAPWVIILMALSFFAIGAGCGIWLIYSGRPFVIVIGLLGLAAGWAYSAPPLQLMSMGWGEVLIFFAFGPLVSLGSYYVMSGFLSWPAFALGLSQGFFITAVIWINQFPDYQADRRARKKNLVVRLGPANSRYPYCVIMLLGFVSVFFLVSIVGMSYLIMLSFISFPLAIRAMIILWKDYMRHERVVPAQALTIKTLTAHGFLLSLGLFLSRLIDP